MKEGNDKNRELILYTIKDLSQKIREKSISPVELTNAYLDRIELVDKELNSFIEVYRDSALKRAIEFEKEILSGNIRGPLHGIPIALKDIFDVKDRITTVGSKMLRNNFASSNATVVDKLETSGAIIIGKTSLVEFAFGSTGLNPHYPQTVNPWNHDKIPGGSSSGSGVAVASKLCLGALGTDTGGSVRMPASLCGISGFKPSYGLVSKSGVFPLSWTLDHVGPLARTPYDCGVIMNSISGYDSSDKNSISMDDFDFNRRIGKSIKGIKIGVPQEYFFDDLDSEIEDKVNNSISFLEDNGAIIQKISCPWVKFGRSINFIISSSEGLSIHENWLKKFRDQYDPQVKSRFLSAKSISSNDYIKALKSKEWFTAKMNNIFKEIDLIISPTIPILATDIEGDPTIGNRKIPLFTGVFNVTGHPSLSVNAGFSKNKLPIGLMISGRHMEDDLVLQVGEVIGGIESQYYKSLEDQI
ncbi:MAG: amidase [Dehalococcoidia bacterium]|nr:amidase [Dehalococcoidia bacterium]